MVTRGFSKSSTSPVSGSTRERCCRMTLRGRLRQGTKGSVPKPESTEPAAMSTRMALSAAA